MTERVAERSMQWMVDIDRLAAAAVIATPLSRGNY